MAKVFEQPVVLLFIDGWGIAPWDIKGNCFSLAQLKNIPSIIKCYPAMALTTPFNDCNIKNLFDCYKQAYLETGLSQKIDKKTTKNPIYLIIF